MQFELPKLEYSFDSLEPYIDKETMQIHYEKHHQGYLNKFNDALSKVDKKHKTVKDIMKNISIYPESVRNNGGGFYNHSLYWENLSPKSESPENLDIYKEISKKYGSFDNFKKEFSSLALSLFGSGWIWLSIDRNGEIFISITSNQDNPLMNISKQQGIPLLAIDVWEHAYYLKHQNKRGDYISSIWNIINWDVVNKRYLDFINSKK
ncbi:superoxide dismutase [bacterium]|nr:superoxide dismutase [bacterium]